MDVYSNADDLTNLAQFKHRQFCVYLFQHNILIQIDLIEQYLRILSTVVSLYQHTHPNFAYKKVIDQQTLQFNLISVK